MNLQKNLKTGLSAVRRIVENPVLIDKAKWLDAIVPGKSFADIGGLWGTVNELVTVAAAKGASRVMMADIQTPGNDLWKAFHERCAARGVKNVEELHIDITQHDAAAILGPFDVVHCSGIIYHLPDPFGAVLNLRRITREHLILSSMYVPDHISSSAGDLDLSGGQALFIPALSGRAKEVCEAHFRSLGLEVGGVSVPEPHPLVDASLTIHTGPWYWLFTPTFLRALLRLARFEILEEGDNWEKRAYSFLCRPV